MNIAIAALMWITYFITLYFLIFWLMFFFENRRRIREDMHARHKNHNSPLVTVVIPAYNEEKSIGKTLLSLINLEYPREKLEVIVINDGSKDRTRQIVEEIIATHPEMSISLFNQENRGKVVAINKALKLARGDYFGCLDADSFVEKTALQRMIGKFAEDPELTILTPVLKIYRPKTLLQKFQRLEYITAMLIIKLIGYLDANYVAPGPFSLYRMKNLRKLGKFDESSLVEDQDIVYRAQAKHYKIRQCSQAVVYTIAPSNWKSLQKQRNRWFKGTLLNIHKYRRLLFNKDYGDFGNFQLPLILSSYLMAVAALITICYYVLKPLIEKIHNLSLIGFDVWPYLKSLKLNFNILNIEITTMFIIYLSLFICFLLLFFSSRLINERIRKHGSIYIIPYFFIYFILMSLIVVRVLFEIMFKKKQKW